MSKYLGQNRGENFSVIVLVMKLITFVGRLRRLQRRRRHWCSWFRWDNFAWLFFLLRLQRSKYHSSLEEIGVKLTDAQFYRLNVISKFGSCISLDCSVLILDEARIWRRITYALCRDSRISFFLASSCVTLLQRKIRRNRAPSSRNDNEGLFMHHDILAKRKNVGDAYARWCMHRRSLPSVSLSRKVYATRREWCLLSYGPFSLVRSLCVSALK